MGHDTKPATEDANCTGLVAETVGRMASYLRWILHPDGEIPLFNDSAFGVARPSSELLARAEQVAQSFSNWSVDRAALAKGENTALSPSPKGEGFSINLCPRPRGEGGDRARRESRVRGFSGQQAAKARFSYTFQGAPCGTTATTHALADTGYAVIRETESESCLVFDAGPLGPDHQPGHGHCDILSYELSLHGQRVVVDTGVSTYEPGPDRHYERSTAAHNTLRVDGEEQAEIWGEFRVGWRPHVGRVSVGEVEGISFARGEYTGRSGLVHSRAVLHVPGRDVATWVIVDCLRGRGLHRAESFVHLHPAVRVEACEPRGHRDESAGARRLACDAETMCRQALLSFGGHRYLLMSLGAAELAVSQSWYSPEFGVRMPCHALSSVWEGRLPTTMVHAFVPAGGPPPVVGLTPEGKAIEMNGRIVPLE